MVSHNEPGLHTAILANHFSHIIGDTLIPFPNQQGIWRELRGHSSGNPLLDHLRRIANAQLARDYLFDISWPTVPSTLEATPNITFQTQEAELLKSPRSGSRKNVIVANAYTEDFEGVRNAIRQILHKNINGYPLGLDGNPLLPEALRIAVKGTGSTRSIVTQESFSRTNEIEGYTAYDSREYTLATIFSGWHNVLGIDYLYLPSRFPVARHIIDKLRFPGSRSIPLAPSIPTMPLATGKNQLEAIAFAEIGGTDFQDFLSLSGNLSPEDTISYLRRYLAWHPLLGNLFTSISHDNSEQIFMNYVRSLHLKAHFDSWIEATRVSVGFKHNRTPQNTGIDGGLRDPDDVKFLPEPLAVGSREHYEGFGQLLYLKTSVFAQLCYSLNIDPGLLSEPIPPFDTQNALRVGRELIRNASNPAATGNPFLDHLSWINDLHNHR